MSDEAHLSAEQSRAQAPARLPRPHGDGRRPQGDRRAPRPRPQAPVGLTTPSIARLTRRADYLAANGGLRAPTAGFVLLVRPRGDLDPAIRIGITVSRKVGGAVVRNRMKRRLRELARSVLPEAGIAGADHVLIGRGGGIERPFAELRADLERALARLAPKAVRPEPVEGRSFTSQRKKKEGASTAPDQVRGRTGRSNRTGGEGS
jgi:ribonuclease P protein component